MVHSQTLLVICVASLMLLSSLPMSCARGAGKSGKKKPLTYHGGPLVTGNVKLSLLWYGNFEPVQKSAISNFIESLNHDGAPNHNPKVTTWWHKVESYQSSLGKRSKARPNPINVQVVREQVDPSYSIGKVLIQQEFIPSLVQKAAAGLSPDTVAVILADRQVAVQGMCTGQCAVHGVIGKTLYVIVNDPTDECPGACAWPFHPSDNAPNGAVLRPPNGHVGADAMATNFASGLASVVTNPYSTGFSEGQLGRSNKIAEATTKCPQMFGSQAAPGNAGKVLVSPDNGGSFNAHGVKGSKFLLPAIWDPATRSCWTLM